MMIIAPADAAPALEPAGRSARPSEAQMLLAHAWSRLTQPRLGRADLAAVEQPLAVTAVSCCATFAELGVPAPLGLRLMAESILQRHRSDS